MNKKFILPSVLLVIIVFTSISVFNSSFLSDKALFSITSANKSLKIPETFEEKLDELRESKNIPGLSVAIIANNKHSSFAVGYSDQEAETSLSKDHLMLTGSVGKSFFAAATLYLKEKGTFNLDDKVVTYLGNYDWYNKLPNSQEITVRSLLNHTSGVPEYIYSQSIWQSLRDNPSKEWTIDERMSVLAGSEAQFPVGKGWAYADANYIILGAFLEEVTGESIYHFVDVELFKPNKILATKPSVKQEIDGLTAGYTGAFFANLFGEKVASEGVYSFNPQIEWTGGGYVSTSDDLAHWIQRLYTGKILESEETKQMFSPVNRQTGEVDKTGYGLGTEIFETRYGRAFGHTGFMPGYSSFMAYFPSLHLSLAFQMNSDPFNRSLAPGTSTFTLADDILAELIPEPNAYKDETTIFFVRHAEREEDGTRDPGLSKDGIERANELAKLFSDKKLTQIYSSPFQRTIQTATPVSEALDIPVSMYNPNDINSIFEMIANNQGKSILIVGHSNTIPTTINYLFKDQKLNQIAEDEYDNIFEVTFSSKTQSLNSSKQNF